MKATGHTDPLSYTPRQMVAWLGLARKRHQRESAHNLALYALAAQGGEKAIKAQLRALQKDSD